MLIFLINVSEQIIRIVANFHRRREKTVVKFQSCFLQSPGWRLALYRWFSIFSSSCRKLLNFRKSLEFNRFFSQLIERLPLQITPSIIFNVCIQKWVDSENTCLSLWLWRVFFPTKVKEQFLLSRWLVKVIFLCVFKILLKCILPGVTMFIWSFVVVQVFQLVSG